MTSSNGNIVNRWPVNSPHKGQWRGALMFSEFDLRLNKWLSIQQWGWWFETPSRPSWRYCNELVSCPVALWGRVDAAVNYHWFRQWLVAWATPSHYLNQYWNVVNWTLRNKFQRNLNRHSYTFMLENAFGNGVCDLTSILPRLQYFKVQIDFIHIFQDYCTEIGEIKLYTGLILDLRPAYGRRRYKVTPSLIGWAQT